MPDEDALGLLERNGAPVGSLLLTKGDRRWLVPVAERRTARTALRIYRPMRTRAIAAWHLARAGAGAGLLRAAANSRSVVRPSFADALGRLLDFPDVRVAAAMPQGIDRAVLAAIACDGRLVAFAKVAAGGIAVRRLERERDALVLLRDVLPPAVRAPGVLAYGEVDGLTALVLSPVHGRIGGRRLSHGRLAGQAALASNGAPRLLGDLISLDVPSPEGWASLLDGARAALEPWIDRPVAPAIVHGDFVPWNLLDRRGGFGAFDWEDAAVSGPPFWDLWHYATQTAGLLGWGDELTLARAARHGHGRLGASLRAYAARAGVPFAFAAPVLVAYLARSPLTVAEHGDPSRGDRVAALDFRARALAHLLEEWP